MVEFAPKRKKITELTVIFLQLTGFRLNKWQNYDTKSATVGHKMTKLLKDFQLFGHKITEIDVG
ncbi:hypothetical protein HGG78_03300 [Vibrio aestuarianus]|nr:hypothetical protein ACS86_14650 [Vibrio alginolyticus]MDF9401473.1 hypothetical protein [Vibrio sp. 1180_3]NGZ12796.1 hypothetical protein [Vibrio aestuarianus]NGZ68955.1 hypothetical protein [Vibrio aestuarianus subsp. cardii]NLS58962.1 hypothetical protein [Vibrio aestuarianus subsp. francensis]